MQKTSQPNVSYASPIYHFSGMDHEDPVAFIKQMDRHFLRVHITDDMDKLLIASEQLRGEARRWFEPYKTLLGSYETFVDRLYDKFDSASNVTTAMAKLYGEKQKNHESAEMFITRKQNMKINTFYVILDNLSSELIRRKIAYESVSNTFGFMGSLCDLSDNQISTDAANLWQSYQSELDRDFAEECIQFKYFLKALKEENKEENYSMAEILQVPRRLKIVATYPNIDTALKIFLTIPATNVTEER